MRFSSNPRVCLQPKIEYNDDEPAYWEGSIPVLRLLTHLLKVEFLKIDGLLGLPGGLVVDGEHRRLASHELNLETRRAKKASSSRPPPRKKVVRTLASEERCGDKI